MIRWWIIGICVVQDSVKQKDAHRKKNIHVRGWKRENKMMSLLLKVSLKSLWNLFEQSNIFLKRRLFVNSAISNIKVKLVPQHIFHDFHWNIFHFTCWDCSENNSQGIFHKKISRFLQKYKFSCYRINFPPTPLFFQGVCELLLWLFPVN